MSRVKIALRGACVVEGILAAERLSRGYVVSLTEMSFCKKSPSVAAPLGLRVNSDGFDSTVSSP